MVNPEKKSKDGPGGVKGHTALPYHGNTEHPHTRHPYHGYSEIHNSSRTENTTEKRGGRKSNRRKKSMKKKGKTAKKRITKKTRKTRRRKVAGAPRVFTEMYRRAHKSFRGIPSQGEQGEIDAAAKEAAKAAAKAADLVELRKLRKDDYYTEVNHIKEFEVGSTYVEFQGAGEELKNLGEFIKQWDIMGSYGVVDVTLEFQNGKLRGFTKMRDDDDHHRARTTVHNVFKVNYGPILSDKNKNFTTKNNEKAPKKKMNIPGLNDDMQNKIAGYFKGGRKRKTRKTKKSRRARN
jgi:vacuolar-type H+-ATPase subunit E/Vma4